MNRSGGEANLVEIVRMSSAEPLREGFGLPRRHIKIPSKGVETLAARGLQFVME